MSEELGMNSYDAAAAPIASLFMLHTESNVGYAIAPLERLFFETGLALSDNDQSQVHFSYKSLATGKPSTLPENFDNLIELDYSSIKDGDLARLTAYSRSNHIEAAVIFDMQPTHPVIGALRRGGVKTILGYYGCEISSVKPFWKLCIKRLLFALSRSKMDGLIFESKAMADLAVMGRGVPQNRIDVVHLGVDIKIFHPGKSSHVCDVMDLPPGHKVIAYAGHMGVWKGVHSLIRAAVELLVRRKRTDVSFVLYGNRPNESEQYESMYAGMGIDRLIRFGGYRSDMAEIYRGCFCGVIPSTGYDSFPRTSVEMAASGLPVIAARTGGLPESVLHDCTGIVYEPGNVQELADSIEKLLDQPELAARYSRAGRERCERELSLEAQYERFLGIVRSRLQGSQMSRRREGSVLGMATK
jgi:glycosyltransferase involved in cell wall biosynthesis